MKIDRRDPGNAGRAASAAPLILLETVSARDRRTMAIRFLRSDESMASLLRRCRDGDAMSTSDARVSLACVLLMAGVEDAPRDLVLTDPGLYRVLRNRITEIRMGGWV